MQFRWITFSFQADRESWNGHLENNYFCSLTFLKDYHKTLWFFRHKTYASELNNISLSYRFFAWRKSKLFILSILSKPKLESPTKERLPCPSQTKFNQHYSGNIKITGNNKIIASINWQKNELCLESKILSAVFGNSSIVMHFFSISLWRMELPLPLSVMYCFPRIHTGSLVFGNTSCSKEIASYVVQAVSISRPAMFSFHLQFTKHRHFDSSTSRLKSKVLTHSTLEEQVSPNLVPRTRLRVSRARLVQTCSKCSGHIAL